MCRLRRWERIGLVLLVAVFFLGKKSAWAMEQEKPLLIGIYPTPPFVMLDAQKPQGFSIDLWKIMADDLNLRYRFVSSATIAGVLEDVSEDRVDAGLGALSITLLREERVDFTHSYFHTGLGIMVGGRRTWSFSVFIRSFFSKQKILLLGGLGIFICAVGHLIWFVERKYATKQPSFDKRYLPGVLDGMYWAIVTASTVGYGDKVARSRAGRLLGVILIITSLPFFAYLTAKLASDITLHEIRTGITGPRDLIERRIGVREGSTAQDYVASTGAVMLSFVRLDTAYHRLEQGHLDAVVHDRPILLYYAANHGRGRVEVLATTFSQQDYGIALPENSPLNEQFNREILRLKEDGRLQGLHDKWFGKGFAN